MKAALILGLMAIGLLVVACGGGPASEDAGETQVAADAPLTQEEVDATGLAAQDIEDLDAVMAELDDLDQQLDFDELDGLDQDLALE